MEPDQKSEGRKTWKKYIIFAMAASGAIADTGTATSRLPRNASTETVTDAASRADTVTAPYGAVTARS
jgi:hypothetical protein